MTTITVTPDVASDRTLDVFKTIVTAFRADGLSVPSANGFGYSDVAAHKIELFFSGQDIEKDDSDPQNPVITGGTVNSWDIRDFSSGLTFLETFEGYNGELKAVDVFSAVEKLIADPNDTEWLDVFGAFDYKMGPSAGNVIFRGFGGDDTMLGGAGLDTFDDRFGGDNDMFNGGSGNDFARVGGGISTLGGGEGTDRLSFGLLAQGSATGIIFNMHNGVFSSSPGVGASGTARSFEIILGSTSQDKIGGNDFGNQIDGNAGDDVIGGRLGDDILRGGAGNDALTGNEGADTLTGGLGRDVLAGGADADVFDFNSAAESGVGAAARDIITGFDASDIIDLGDVDANSVAAGNQAFKFIGDAGFSGVAGQLRVADFHSDTLIAGDRDGDSTADFHILLKGAVAISAGDFIL